MFDVHRDEIPEFRGLDIDPIEDFRTSNDTNDHRI